MNIHSYFSQIDCKRLVVTTLISLAGCQYALAGTTEEFSATSERFQFRGDIHDVVDYRGRKALRLKDALAEIANIDFTTGIIEFDVALPRSRGFSGVRFHVGSGDDEGTMEEFYIRPHQYAKPDATQYTPVFRRVTGWQLYHGPQFSFAYTPPKDDWQHVKIVVGRDRADIYVDDMEIVALAVPELKTGMSGGGVQLYSARIPALFAGLKITHEKMPNLSGKPVALPETPVTRIKTWQVSDVVSETSLDEKPISEIAAPLAWKTLEAEENGITNLARVSNWSRERNTVLARKILTAMDDMSPLLQFGYSDRVRVYLNGQEIYRGNNTYRTRDFRYLGTIGLFDAVPLNLKAGENELVLAVSESFGGWGVMGDLPETPGLQID